MSDPNLVGNPQSVPLCKCKLNTLDPHFLGKPYTYVINSDCEEFNIPKDPAWIERFLKYWNVFNVDSP